MNELAYLSAAEALRLFRSRELSPVELLTAVIERAEQVEPTVNALCHTLYEPALDQARQAEARYAGRGPAPRPLEGIPLAVKEEEPIAGQPCTQGSLLLKDEIADHTSCLARRILDSGAIMHARTTVPEFSAAAITRSKLWGTTRNPWNPDYAVGGSSGGSGAALAAGTTTLASGSDIAGSIRIPASFNGVVGYKPPYGRVPVDPPFNHDTYLHNGPMARTVADAALLQNVIAGPDPSDIASLSPRLELPDRFGTAEGLRVAVSVDLGGWTVDPEIRKNTLDVADALRSAGAVVEEVDLSLPREQVNRAASIHYGLTIGFLEELIAGRPDDTSPYLAAVVERIRRQSRGGDIAEKYALESELYAPVAGVLRSFDVLLCPTVATTGLSADEDYAGDVPIEVDGEVFWDPIDTVLTLPFNVLGRCPVLAVPSGFAANGVPTGVQLVGAPYDDEIVFRAGAALESVRPWFAPDGRRPEGTGS
ncbi:amidase [Streptomyces spongiae]|uniref:Amidase n=1 Tax=Streptomyces spongiae TaxID=565072 RepID=A0A5N8XAX7_9ACTN|nr:amidase [Streptomyces spongiae]MPY56547.1 amidase [Streptomyces spongiae]